MESIQLEFVIEKNTLLFLYLDEVNDTVLLRELYFKFISSSGIEFFRKLVNDEINSKTYNELYIDIQKLLSSKNINELNSLSDKKHNHFGEIYEEYSFPKKGLENIEISSKIVNSNILKK
jgi:hypothetical protein